MNCDDTSGVDVPRKITSLAEFCAEGERLGLTALDLAEALKDRPEFADCLPAGGGACLSSDGAANHCVLWKCHEAKACAHGVAGTSDASAWWALVMGAAAFIGDAANCLRDPDAKKQAEGAAKHYREAAQKLWAARGVAPSDGALS